MNNPPINLSLRQGKRRPTRFRATVEALDTRQLMASGVVGSVAAVSGFADSPLLTLQYNIPPVSGLGGFLPSQAPVGTPIPLVRLFGPISDSLSGSGYSGTVDWGDGSPVDTALFGNFVLTTPLVLPNNTLLVSGPDHTYQSPGSYPITVSVTGPGDSAPTVYHDTAAISEGITGQLNPSGDSGYFNNDNITAIDTPNYFGTASPGASVSLSATSNVTGQTLVVGTGVASASGTWNITTVPLANGSYSINAQATDKSGNTANALLAGRFNRFTTDYLVIDTAGPKITSFQVTNAKTGTFQVGFSDSAGLFVGPLTSPSNYVVGRPSPTPKKGQTFSVATLTLNTPVTPTVGSAPPLTFIPVLVSGTLSATKPLINGNGVYTFTIHAAGIISLAGSALDGEYTGKFPSGNGQAGGDFQVKVNVKNGKASGPIAIKPIKAKVTHIVAKAASKHHA